MHWLVLLQPWQFSPTVALALLLAAIVYARGARLQPTVWWRNLCFWSGLILLYAALETHCDYYAEREFFVHRIQHLVLHHLAPFLIAVAWPAAQMRTGTPSPVRHFLGRLFAYRLVVACLDVLTNPVVAGTLFVGLIWLWLVPVVHFYAMLDVRLYRLMNWSMALDGIVFWCLALDPRSQPPARLSPGVRVILQAAVIPPQVASGAILTFASRNLYPLYDLCGRAFGGISAHDDQTIGALVLWIPSTMMSLVGVLIAMYAWFQLAERTAASPRVNSERHVSSPNH